MIVSKWGPEVFASMRAGGVTAANCTVSVWEGFQPTCDNIAAFKRWFREHADTIREVRSVADIRAAKAEGRALAKAHDGWLPLWDEAAGAYYYYHAKTGDVRWERPAAAVTTRHSGHGRSLKSPSAAIGRNKRA